MDLPLPGQRKRGVILFPDATEIVFVFQRWPPPSRDSFAGHSGILRSTTHGRWLAPTLAWHLSGRGDRDHGALAERRCRCLAWTMACL